LLGPGNNPQRAKERQSLQGCQIYKNAAETQMASFDIPYKYGDPDIHCLHISGFILGIFSQFKVYSYQLGQLIEILKVSDLLEDDVTKTRKTMIFNH
jgi:hypothetical protein